MSGVRAIFFDSEDADAVVARLRHDGFEASSVRERLSGEDDDEDHPWAVLSDAPEFVLEVLVDEYEGWLDHEEDEAADEAPPLRLPPSSVFPGPLPDAPRRIKRPDLLDPPPR